MSSSATVTVKLPAGVSLRRARKALKDALGVTPSQLVETAIRDALRESKRAQG